MLVVVGWKVWPVSNFAQQHPTTCNRVCKQTQHVTSNNVGSFWPTMLRPFAQGFKLLNTVLVILHLKSRFSFPISSLQNNNITRIPDQAFKNQNALEVMYVRKWLPLVVATIRYAFCVVTWEDHRFRFCCCCWFFLVYLIRSNLFQYRILFRNVEAAYGTQTSKR